MIASFVDCPEYNEEFCFSKYFNLYGVAFELNASSVMMVRQTLRMILFQLTSKNVSLHITRSIDVVFACGR